MLLEARVNITDLCKARECLRGFFFFLPSSGREGKGGYNLKIVMSVCFLFNELSVHGSPRSQLLSYCGIMIKHSSPDSFTCIALDAPVVMLQVQVQIQAWVLPG